MNRARPSSAAPTAIGLSMPATTPRPPPPTVRPNSAAPTPRAPPPPVAPRPASHILRPGSAAASMQGAYATPRQSIHAAQVSGAGYPSSAPDLAQHEYGERAPTAWGAASVASTPRPPVSQQVMASERAHMERLKADIRAVHKRCEELRATAGSRRGSEAPEATSRAGDDMDVKLARYGFVSSDAHQLATAKVALAELLASKMAELDRLLLRSVTNRGNVRPAGKDPPGLSHAQSFFGVAETLLSLDDAISAKEREAAAAKEAAAQEREAREAAEGEAALLKATLEKAADEVRVMQARLMEYESVGAPKRRISVAQPPPAPPPPPEASLQMPCIECARNRSETSSARQRADAAENHSRSLFAELESAKDQIARDRALASRFRALAAAQQESAEATGAAAGRGAAEAAAAAEIARAELAVAREELRERGRELEEARRLCGELRAQLEAKVGPRGPKLQP
eukprot:tig00000058_g750.t1